MSVVTTWLVDVAVSVDMVAATATVPMMANISALSTSAVVHMKRLEAEQWGRLIDRVRAENATLGSGIACCLEPRNTGRCHIVIVRGRTVMLDPRTPEPTVDTPYHAHDRGTLRIVHVVAHLRMLAQMSPLPATTFAIYTADTVDQCLRDTTAFVHSSHALGQFALLYPTAYLLQDRMSGVLRGARANMCRHNATYARKPFPSRIGQLLFVGHRRTPFRVAVAALGLKNPTTMNIRLSKIPSVSEWTKRAPAVPFPNVTTADTMPWEEKANYRFLLHMSGGYSSQWRVWTDFFTGGLIFRHKDDRCEFWNCDFWGNANYTETYDNYTELPTTVKSYNYGYSLRRASERAARAHAIACHRLDDEPIDWYVRHLLHRVSMVPISGGTSTISITKPSAEEPSQRWGTATHLLERSDCHADRIQEAALHDGVFWSGDLPRVYSTDEARECLRGKRVVFSGDSYCMQHFIGLVDVLAGEPSNEEIRNATQRRIALKQSQLVTSRFKEQGTELLWQCGEFTSCYGAGGYLDTCRQCLGATNATIIVLSTGVHMMSTLSDKLNKSLYQDAHEFDRAVIDAMVKEIAITYETVGTSRLVWGSAPSYNKMKIPMPYRDTMPLNALDHVYAQSMLRARAMGVRFLDFHRLTQECVWANCTADGGHRSRFVNRAKAQLLLEAVCDSPPRPLCDGVDA